MPMNLFSFAQDWKELNRFESLDISERSIVFYAETKASMNYFMIVVLGVVNLILGAFMTYLYLTQVKNVDPRKDSKYKRRK